MVQGVFRLVRLRDCTGIAGTGVVAHGYVAPNGKASMFWTVPCKPQTVVVADCFEDLCVHLHGGQTMVEWVWAEDVSETI